MFAASLPRRNENFSRKNTKSGSESRILIYRIASLWFASLQKIEALTNCYFYSIQQQIQHDDDITIPFINICRFNRHIVWDIVMFGANGILLIYGAIIAWQAKRIDISNFHHVQSLAIATYNLMIFVSIGVTMSIVISESPAIRFILISVFIILSSLSTNCLIFIPKV